MDSMAIRVVGLVRTMRPTYLSRPRIKMQSYDGTFSVRRTSRSLNACSSLSTRGVPAILPRARLYTEATIRRALNDGGAMCIEKGCVTRPGTCTKTISVEQECVQIQKCAKPKLRAKTGVRHTIAVRHHNRSQVSIPIDHIDSHVTLLHGDAEAAVHTPPFFNLLPCHAILCFAVATPRCRPAVCPGRTCRHSHQRACHR